MTGMSFSGSTAPHFPPAPDHGLGLPMCGYNGMESAARGLQQSCSNNHWYLGNKQFKVLLEVIVKNLILPFNLPKYADSALWKCPNTSPKLSLELLHHYLMLQTCTVFQVLIAHLQGWTVNYSVISFLISISIFFIWIMMPVLSLYYKDLGNTP